MESAEVVDITPSSAGTSASTSSGDGTCTWDEFKTLCKEQWLDTAVAKLAASASAAGAAAAQTRHSTPPPGGWMWHWSVKHKVVTCMRVVILATQTHDTQVADRMGCMQGVGGSFLSATVGVCSTDGSASDSDSEPDVADMLEDSSVALDTATVVRGAPVGNVTTVTMHVLYDATFAVPACYFRLDDKCASVLLHKHPCAAWLFATHRICCVQMTRRSLMPLCALMYRQVARISTAGQH